MLANNLCPSEEAPNYAQFQVIKPTCEAFQEWNPAAAAPVQYPQAQQFPFLFPQSEWSYPTHLQLQQPTMLQPHEMKVDTERPEVIQRLPHPWPYPFPNEDAAHSQLSDDSEPGCPDDLEAFAKQVQAKKDKTRLHPSGRRFGIGNPVWECVFSDDDLSIRSAPINMCKLKPLLFKWLEEADSTSASPNSAFEKMTGQGGRKRKKRTSIEVNVKSRLEYHFQKNHKPNAQEILQVANELGLDKEVVRVWFCNRRQKEKRMTPQFDQQMMITSPYPPSDIFYPSGLPINPSQFELRTGSGSA
ncbi:homeobox domain protein [Ostertagia ostertagi]